MSRRRKPTRPVEPAPWFWLSAASRAWAWQDSAPLTQLRELIAEWAENYEREARAHAAASLHPHYHYVVVSKGRPNLRTVLHRLRATQEVCKRLWDEQEVLVAEARHLGASWEAVGSTLEMTKQGAHSRFEPGESEGTDYYSKMLRGRLEAELYAARAVAFDILRSSARKHSASVRAEAQALFDRLELWMPEVWTPKAKRGREPRTSDLQLRGR